MNWTHYLKVITKIATTRYPYSRVQLGADYVRLLFHSIQHHKFKSRLKAGEVIFAERFLGFEILFFNYPQLLHLLEEIFVFEEYKSTAFQKNSLIIDCGSNIGLSALYFKKVFPEARLVCVEPDKDAFTLLRKNIENNRLTNVKTMHAALSRHRGTATLYRKEQGSVNASLSKMQDAHSVEVTTERLSDFIEEETDLIKIDVEGAEEDILADLVQTDSLGKVRQLVIEFHSMSVSHIDQWIQQLIIVGFICRRVVTLSSAAHPVLNFVRK